MRGTLSLPITTQIYFIFLLNNKNYASFFIIVEIKMSTIDPTFMKGFV